MKEELPHKIPPVRSVDDFVRLSKRIPEKAGVLEYSQNGPGNKVVK